MSARVSHHSIIPSPVLSCLSVDSPVVEPVDSFVNALHNDCRIHQLTDSRDNTHQVIVDLHASDDCRLTCVCREMHRLFGKDEVVSTATRANTISIASVVCKIGLELTKGGEGRRDILNTPFVHTTRYFMLRLISDHSTHARVQKRRSHRSPTKG